MDSGACCSNCGSSLVLDGVEVVDVGGTTADRIRFHCSECDEVVVYYDYD